MHAVSPLLDFSSNLNERDVPASVNENLKQEVRDGEKFLACFYLGG